MSNSNPSEATFPQEIFDQIIDSLPEDKVTLSNCSLVCKAWISTCRRHLFHQMWLNQLTWEIFPESLYSYPRIFLLDITPSFDGRDIHRVKHVPESELMVIFFLRLLLPKLLHFLLPDPPLERELPRPWLYSRLPSVEFLLIKSSAFHPMICDLHSLHGLPSALPRLTSLEMHTGFGTFSERVSFICSFPELQVLALRFRTSPGIGERVGHLRLSNRVHTVTLSDPSIEFPLFLEWLGQMEPPPRIATLRVICPRSEDMLALSRLTFKIGKSLQQLRIYFDHAVHYSSAAHSISFVPLTTKATQALKYFWLHLGTPQLYVQYLMAYLQNTEVKNPIFICSVGGPGEFQDFSAEWSYLDQMMMCYLQIHPNCILIHTGTIHHVPVAKSLLPQCSAAGILHFVYPDTVGGPAKLIGQAGEPSSELDFRLEEQQIYSIIETCGKNDD